MKVLFWLIKIKKKAAKGNFFREAVKELKFKVQQHNTWAESESNVSKGHATTWRAHRSSALVLRKGAWREEHFHDLIVTTCFSFPSREIPIPFTSASSGIFSTPDPKKELQFFLSTSPSNQYWRLLCVIESKLSLWEDPGGLAEHTNT